MLHLRKLNDPAKVWRAEIIRRTGDSLELVRGEDPFYIVDLGDIVCKYKLWKTKMPRITPYYAVKCNDTPVILEVLAALGTGFDCASKLKPLHTAIELLEEHGILIAAVESIWKIIPIVLKLADTFGTEIEAAMKVGATGSSIIYANPCKTGAFIKHAEAVGVDMMTFDNEMELHKIASIFPAARLVLRIRVDDSSAVCQLGLKFGADLKDCSHLLNVARELGLNVVGLSFHVGSGCQDAKAYRDAITNSHHVFQLARKFGYNFTMLDIGGGFPGIPGAGVSFEEIADVVTESLDQYFPVGCGIDIIAEPGRFFVASAFTLCTNVIAKRVLDIPNDKGLSDLVTQYYVNDGVYGSFNCLVFDHALVQPVALKKAGGEEGPLHHSGIWGPTCDSMDRILEKCELPDLDIGEWILFENMGAYTIAAASRFNGFDLPALHLVLPLPIKVYLEKLPAWTRLSSTLDFVDPSLAATAQQGALHLPTLPTEVCA
ncbi:ODC1 [Cordylochernes scorpioides]|uniref:ornithine decarboxylase n=1 Tax=Cordylochernes scorpioides TaxID=51811 RepID=A0ABY6LAZ0_9ARAC|nr:ODC1 [Cordylochernes scorpioides]